MSGKSATRIQGVRAKKMLPCTLGALIDMPVLAIDSSPSASLQSSTGTSRQLSIIQSLSDSLTTQSTHSDGGSIAKSADNERASGSYASTARSPPIKALYDIADGKFIVGRLAEASCTVKVVRLEINRQCRPYAGCLNTTRWLN